MPTVTWNDLLHGLYHANKALRSYTTNPEKHAEQRLTRDNLEDEVQRRVKAARTAARSHQDEDAAEQAAAEALGIPEGIDRLTSEDLQDLLEHVR